jgi:hypothetical protein
MGKANAAAVAAHYRVSFPNIRLGIIVGVYGAVPFDPDGNEVVLGDVIISDGTISGGDCLNFARKRHASRLVGKAERRDTRIVGEAERPSRSKNAAR